MFLCSRFGSCFAKRLNFFSAVAFLLNTSAILATKSICTFQNPDNQYKIIAGAHRISEVDRTSGAQSALVTGAVIHPKLNRTYYNFDFVLLKLDRDIKTGPTVKFARLPTERFEFRDAEKSCVVAGWGMWQDLSMDPSDVLRKGPMKVTYFASEILNVAPDGPNLSSTCIGDSGGPLYCPAKDGGDPYQVGLLTGGAGICGYKRGSKTFARIAYVIDWIKQNA